MMNVEYRALHDRKSGILSLRAHDLSFSNSDNTVQFEVSYPSVQVDIEGQNNKLIVIRDIYNPRHELLVENPAILESLEKMGVHSAREARSQWMQRSNSKIGKYLLSGLLLASLILLGPKCLSLLPVSWLDSMVPVNWLTPLGEKVARDIGASSGTEIQKIEDIVRTNLDQAVLERLNAIYLVDSETPNAMMLPGGIMVLNSGLILQARSVEEVFGIIGHELGHLQYRHNLKSIISNLSLITVQMSLSFFTEWGGTLFGGIGELGRLSYSREAEREADQYAAELLYQSKISVRGMLDFFQRVKRAEGKSGHNRFEEKAKSLSLIRTHPVSEERAKFFEARLKQENGSFSPVRISLIEIQSLVKASVSSL